MTLSQNPIKALASNLTLLSDIRRGVEKEGLRVDHSAFLASTPHPVALGSTLCNSRITTDYAEALLELITAPHASVEELRTELQHVHQFVVRHLGDEIIWNQSMPAHLPDEADIQIGWYGTSNTGMFKHVYRRGLAERYGKRMQCIAGVHYNYSLPDRIWPLLQIDGRTFQEQRSNGYLALIRNFTRYSWLLMYLFGASPAVSKDFLGEHQLPLEKIAPDTYCLPWATSLRMSDLGYQNKEAQAELQLCYNDLDTFLLRMRRAATTSWPAYADIGTHRNGEWIQLNTNILQIENEYYSNIRPKRTPKANERPSSALANRGVEYIEVRCLDIDPFDPIGLSAETARFLDVFLLFCATEPSPVFPDGGFCQDSKNNFAKVVVEGRKPGLLLRNQNKQDVELKSWGEDLILAMQPYAALFDKGAEQPLYQAALDAQMAKIQDASLCPSARVLKQISESGQSFVDYTYAQSLAHKNHLLDLPFSAELQQEFEQAATDSIAAQQQIEAAEKDQSFEVYLQKYQALLDA
ncbi:MAG: glutamate--cysteine ligase [Alcaligenaceae bacterium]|nr:glutamate--cysteine ligase [Alcaligenaceae bacterium]